MKHVFILKGDTEKTSDASSRISRKYYIVGPNEKWISHTSEDPFDVVGHEVVLISDFILDEDQRHYKKIYESQGRKVIFETELNASFNVETLRRIVEKDTNIRYLNGYIYGFDQDRDSYKRVLQKIKDLGIDQSIVAFPSYETMEDSSFYDKFKWASDADFVFTPKGILQYPNWKTSITEEDLDKWLKDKNPETKKHWHFVLSYKSCEDSSYCYKEIARILKKLNENGNYSDGDVFSYSEDAYIPDGVTKIVISEDTKDWYECFGLTESMGLKNVKQDQEILLEWEMKQEELKEEKEHAQNNNFCSDQYLTDCAFRFYCPYFSSCPIGTKYQHLGCRLSAEAETIRFCTKPNS